MNAQVTNTASSTDTRMADITATNVPGQLVGEGPRYAILLVTKVASTLCRKAIARQAGCIANFVVPTNGQAGMASALFTCRRKCWHHAEVRMIEPLNGVFSTNIESITNQLCPNFHGPAFPNPSSRNSRGGERTSGGTRVSILDRAFCMSRVAERQTFKSDIETTNAQSRPRDDQRYAF
jgi:hypothetical protein